MSVKEKGNIKTELITGIFFLSFLAIVITFFATFKITEKRQLQLEALKMQEVIGNIEKIQPESIEKFLSIFPSQSRYVYGLYNPINKKIVSGLDLLEKEKIFLGVSNIEFGKEFIFPSILVYKTITIGGNPFVIVLKREFLAEKSTIKKDVLNFFPFAVVCLFTLTAFAYMLYKKRLLTPFELLKNAHNEVGEGNFNVRLAQVGIEEWDILYNKFNSMVKYLEEYKSDLEKTIDRLSKANEALKSAQNEIVFSEKMATVGRLAAGLAHEVGNPLTSIMGYLSFMISNTENKEEKEMLTLILNETERINRIIKDLLNFARSRGDELIETCNPRDVVLETIRLLTPQKEFKKIILQNNFVHTMPVKFSGEALKQVLLNLLINAIDVTPSQGTITITSKVENNNLIIEVSDEGGGVPEEIKDKIFEPFFTTKPPGKGTGLGLSVVHTLVEKYGGTIEFENSEKGAIFKVRIKGLEDQIG